LSRPQDNHCPEALDVLAEVKAAYGSDPDIAGIVSAGETICNSLGDTASSVPTTTLETLISPETTTSPGAVIDTTPTPSPELMLDRTATPTP